MGRRPSLRRTLLLGLLSAILLAWSIGVGLVFLEARQEVEEVFSADLARSARVLSTLLQHELVEEQRISRQAKAVAGELGPEELMRYPLLAALLDSYRSGRSEESLDFAEATTGTLHKYESKLALLARYPDGRIMLRTPGGPAFAMGKTGYFDFSGPAEVWHGFGMADPDTGLLVQVGEKEQIRTELVNYIAGHSMASILLVLPLLVLVIWLGVNHALGPLSRLTTEVSHRVPSSLQPLSDTYAPKEILPLVAAINALLERVTMALEHERRFTADAAHELRTPLAALKAHAQVARRQATDPAMTEALNQLLVGVDRTAHLVTQLLTLARADTDRQEDLERKVIDLCDMARKVLADFGQQSIEKAIDLSLDTPGVVHVVGDRTALGVLLRNLVSNALRYTPAGGRVEVRVTRQGNRALLEVADAGPGISAAERGRVFERFYRGAEVSASGSGLGLSIVRRIADLHGGQVSLGDGLNGQGLRVQVWLPAPSMNQETA